MNHHLDQEVKPVVNIATSAPTNTAAVVSAPRPSACAGPVVKVPQHAAR